MVRTNSAGSNNPLIPNGGEAAGQNPQALLQNGAYFRDPSTISTNDLNFKHVIDDTDDVGEQTVLQVEISNPTLMREAARTQLASKNQLLTTRWQTALVATVTLAIFAGACGGLAYWIVLPKVITQPYLLYGESCYMNSRSCDDTRLLWCPAGRCICTSNFQWNATAQNCSCGLYQMWSGVECEDYGSYGDPCSISAPCLPTLTCSTVINQTYSTQQNICDCDNTTYLDISTGQCVNRLSFNATCQTERDCQDWLGLSCKTTTSGIRCACSSTAYWNGSLCASNRMGGESCSASVPCETTKGLTCDSVLSICVCDSDSYWDNVTTFNCEPKKTYAVSCQYDFQCVNSVNLTCPSVTTGCSCPTTSSAFICDCQSTEFWDGQRCIERHSFNGTCPGQYACSSNLVCFLGHCICPGNMVWGTPTPNTCACPGVTVWNSVLNTCQ